MQNKKKTGLLIAILLILLSSCAKNEDWSGDEENPRGSDKENALSALNGHSIDFYYELKSELLRAVSITIQEDGELIAFAYSAKKMFGNDTFTYNKTSLTTADLSMLLMYASATGREEQVGDYEHAYKLVMNFTSPTQGFAEGKVSFAMLFQGQVLQVSDALSWYFIIDSSKLPDKISIDKAKDEFVKNSIKFPECAVSEITDKSAKILGTITTSNNVVIKERGICYSNNATPTINDKKIVATTNNISCEITELKQETTYYVRPYAIIGEKTYYGESKSFSTTKRQYENVSGVSLNKTSSTIYLGETLALVATVKPDNVENKECKWSSSDTAVAIVDNSGKVKAVDLGKATITVSTVDGNKTASCVITVDEDNTITPQIYCIELNEGNHSVLVQGKYAVNPTSSDKYLRVGFCVGTTPYPTVTDITSPILIVNPTTNLVERISGLKKGTTYYIRPYRIVDTAIKYYKGTSFQTIGGDVDIDFNVNSRSGTIICDIKKEGTYEFYTYLWGLSGGWQNNKFGYIGKGHKEVSFHVSDIEWTHYREISAVLNHVESGIHYEVTHRTGPISGY